MRKETKNFVTEKYLTELEESELDMSNLDKVFGGDKWSEEGYDTIRISRNEQFSYEGEAEPISIELLEKVIAKIKKTGATHMEIVNHGDHHGYVFLGLEIRKSTAEEIESFKNKDKKKKELDLEYKNLEKQMKEIQTKYRAIV